MMINFELLRSCCFRDDDDEDEPTPKRRGGRAAKKEIPIFDEIDEVGTPNSQSTIVSTTPANCDAAAPATGTPLTCLNKFVCC